MGSSAVTPDQESYWQPASAAPADEAYWQPEKKATAAPRLAPDPQAADVAIQKAATDPSIPEARLPKAKLDLAAGMVSPRQPSQAERMVTEQGEQRVGAPLAPTVAQPKIEEFSGAAPPIPIGQPTTAFEPVATPAVRLSRPAKQNVQPEEQTNGNVAMVAGAPIIKGAQLDLTQSLLPVGKWTEDEAKKVNPDEHPVMAILADAGAVTANVAQGLATPANLAVIGAMAMLPEGPGEAAAIARLASVGFSIDQAREAYRDFRQGIQQYQSGNIREGRKLLMSGAVQGMFSAMAGIHAAGPEAFGISPEFQRAAAAGSRAAAWDATKTTPQDFSRDVMGQTMPADPIERAALRFRSLLDKGGQSLPGDATPEQAAKARQRANLNFRYGDVESEDAKDLNAAYDQLKSSGYFDREKPITSAAQSATASVPSLGTGETEPKPTEEVYWTPAPAPDELHAQAKAQQPETVKAAAAVAAQVPGAEVVDPGAKSPESIQRKLDQGKEVTDAARAEIVVPDEQAKQQVEQKVSQQLPVTEIGRIQAEGLPITQAKLPNGQELQVATEAEHAVQAQTHDLYAKKEEAAAAGDSKKVEELQKQLDQKHAEAKVPQNIEQHIWNTIKQKDFVLRSGWTDEAFRRDFGIPQDVSLHNLKDADIARQNPEGLWELTPRMTGDKEGAQRDLAPTNRGTLNGRPVEVLKRTDKNWQSTRVRLESGEEREIPNPQFARQFHAESAAVPAQEPAREIGINDLPDGVTPKSKERIAHEAEFNSRMQEIIGDKLGSDTSPAPSKDAEAAPPSQAGNPTQGITSGTPEKPSPSHGAIAVDLDNTLAHYDGYKGPTEIGAPIASEVQRVKELLADNKDVWIYTARADSPEAVSAIKQWTKQHIGQELPVTNVKHPQFKAFIDDRAVKPGEAIPNEQRISGGQRDVAAPESAGTSAVQKSGAEEILQRQPEETGVSGSGRGGVQPGEQREETPVAQRGQQDRAGAEGEKGQPLNLKKLRNEQSGLRDDIASAEKTISRKFLSQETRDTAAKLKAMAQERIAEIEKQIGERRQEPQPEAAKVSAPSDATTNLRRTLDRAQGVPAPGSAGEVRADQLSLDPHRFQYKLGTDAEGVSQILKDAQAFKRDLAGIVTVWTDPANGKTYVVNGHHRVELAKRTKYSGKLPVYNLDAKTADEARAIGALQNIAEGRGTPIDAAKFFRDTNRTLDDLRENGISMGEATAAKGYALSKLDPSLFNRVVQKEMPLERGVAIEEATDDPAEQKAIAHLIAAKERKGQRVSNDTLRELVRFVKGSGQTTETTASLFGEQQITRSLALEKAEVSAYVKEQIGRDKKLFGFVAKGDRANRLAESKAGTIDVDRSKEISQDSAQAEEVYNKLSSYAGPISDILEASAQRLADGENAHTVKSEAYRDIRAAVQETLSGGMAESVRAGEEDTGPRNASAQYSLGSDLEQYRRSSSDDLESWAASAKSVSITPAGDQTDLFGSPTKMYDIALIDSEGETHTRLASQEQLDRAMENGKFRSAVERGKQQGFFTEQDVGAGELHGRGAKPSIALPPQETKEQPTLFGSASSAPDAERRLTDEPTFRASVFGLDILAGKAAAAGQKIGTVLSDRIATEHAKIQNAKSIDDALFQLQKQHEARQIENLQLMRAAGGKPEDWEAIYHNQEDPHAPLTAEQRDLKERFIDPIHSRNEQLFHELRPDAEADKYHVHRVVQGYPSWLERMMNRKGTGGAGRGNVLSKSADSLKGRTMMALDTPDGRRVVALKGGNAIDTETRESWGTVKTEDDGSRSAGGHPLTQATTKEIEAATHLHYYHNAMASEIAENLELERAAGATKYVERLKSSPEFSDFAIKDNGRMGVPEGYARTDLPQLRDYFFEKHVAEVLDDLHGNLKSGDWGAMEKVGDFLTTSLFMNPLVHVPNIAVHSAVNKGKMGVGGFIAPLQTAERRAGMRAIDAVVHQNADYVEALKAGAPLQSHRQDLRDFQHVLFEKMGKEVEENSGLRKALARAFGYPSTVNPVKLWYNLSGKITWTTNDVAYMQHVYSLTDKGYSLPEAIRETSKHIPDYRIPSRVLDSRMLSAFMRNRLFSRFSAYHYGAWKSYGEAMKSAFGLNAAPDTDPGDPHTGGGGRDGKNWKDIRHGWDILAAIGFFTFAVYPALDAALKATTKDKRAQVRRAGAATLPYNLAQMAEGKRTPSQVAESVLTPSVIAERGLGLLYGHDPRTGRAIYDPAAPAGKELFQAGRYAAGSIYPVDQALRTMEKPNSQHSSLWQYAGVSFPKRSTPRHEAPLFKKDWNYYRKHVGHLLP